MAVYSGKHMWIWYINQTLAGDVKAIIAKAKEIGLSGVIIKSNDGANIWSQFKQNAKAFKDAGLTVGAWGYVYGKDVAGEVNAIVDAFNNGADWYVLDPEIEFEKAGMKAVATQMGQMLRNKLPDKMIGYAPFPFPQYHPNYPYKEFSNFCNVVLPQVYWEELVPTSDVCVKQSHDQLAPFGLPIAPIGQTYVSHYDNQDFTPNGSDYSRFGDMCEHLGITGISFWDFQHATTAMLDSVKNLTYFNPIPQSLPVSAPTSKVSTESNPFANVDSWALDSFKKAVQAGVFSGDGKENYLPKDPITREQLAIILDRLGLLKGDVK